VSWVVVSSFLQMHRNKWVQIQKKILLQSANLIGPSQKKIEIMETPQNI
jgi:kynureninase